MKRIAMFLAFFVLGLHLILAQTVQITGTVTSKDDGQPLPGASVSVEGTTIGTTTDFNGKYSLNVPAGSQTLQFAFVGMVTQKVAIGNRSVIDVTLETETVGLDEVVVTALGIKRSEKSLAYSVTQVSNKELTMAGDRSALSALQGKVAGLSVTSSSGAPGASSRILLRGYSSITGNNEPLFIVDGIPVTNSTSLSTNLNNNYDFGNAMNDINPNDIESISVLKGASASALYGSRAASGVIVITTKKGLNNNKLKVDYSGTVTLSEYNSVLRMQNTFGQGWSGHFAFDENGSWGPKFDGKDRLFGRIIDGQQMYKPFVAQPDNYKDFFDRGVLYSNNIAISGGTDRSTFYVSFSNLKDDGILPTKNDNYTRNSVLLKGVTKGKYITLTGSVNYIKKDVSAIGGGQGNTVYNDLAQIPRDFSITDMKDYHNKFYDINGYYTQYGIVNPYFSMNEDGNKIKEDHVFGNIEAVVDIYKNLKFTVRVGNDFLTNSERHWKAVVAPDSWSQNYGSSIEDVGSYNEYSYSRNEFTTDAFLSFSPEIGDFSVNGIAGFNSNSQYAKDLSAGIANLTIPGYYNLTNSAEMPVVDGNYVPRRIVGLLSQVDIGYKKMVFLNIGARNDWSSTLPEGSNSYFYPTVGLTAIVTDIVPVLKEYISYGKLRVNYGVTGKDAPPFSTKSVMTSAGIAYSWVNVTLPFNGLNGFEVSNVIGNPELQPEITKEMEFGADFRFFNNRFGIDFTYYKRNSTNQIMGVPIAASTGYSSQWMNLGNVENKGIELTVKIEPLKTSNLDWVITYNYFQNRSKVIELSEALTKAQVGGYSGFGIFAEAGKPLGFFEAVVPQKTSDGKLIVNNKGLPLASSTTQDLGNTQHDYTMGLTNSVTWKNVSFNFTLDYRKGGLFYSRTADINYFVGHAWKTTYNDRQPFVIPNSVMVNPADPTGETYIENTTAVTMAEICNYWGAANGGGVDMDRSYLVDKSSFRIREISLGYQLPANITSKTPFSSINFSLVAQNILIWLPASNTFVDPDQSTFGNNIGGDFGEFSGAPTVRRFGFNLKLSL